MKLIRYGEAGKEKPGVQLANNQKIDISAFGEDYDEVFFGTNGIARLQKWLDQNKKSCQTISDEVRLGPPCCRPSKIICIGLNYAQHAKEGGMKVPSEPVIFFKATSAMVGPNDDIIIPKGSTKTDWEVELAFIIGQKASYVNKEDAMKHVAGYVLHNDYSERNFQLEREGQWVKGKSCDTFAPIGPFLVTPEEIPNPHNLNLWLKLNGEMVQNSNTSDFIFDIPTVISYLSQFMTLLPGDLISTGTPAGVGLGMTPPRYLQSGDIVELGIEGLGSSRQVAKAYKNVNK